MARILIRKQKRQAQYFTEDLGNGIGLDMIKIPGGTFTMGSPENEPEREQDEGPQHQVSIPEFFFGRYPITQGQWKALVETTETIERDLNPDPSHFKDDYEAYDRWSRPVEQVSWFDAKEFCARLSQKMGRNYRLPSEAEWEYACRAGTPTPFHFGRTITPELANYDGNHTYGKGSKGEYREQTTPVGYFKVANAFGLYDMHGNVYEWCEDDWHENYQGAPNHERAWRLDQRGDSRILRGGSWGFYPWVCRSAYRGNDNPDDANCDVGFRVICALPRALP